MGRRKLVGRKMSMSTETQSQYLDRVEHRRQRYVLCGSRRVYPRPTQAYEPVLALFGMQKLRE